jgi:hypothetical protein
LLRRSEYAPQFPGLLDLVACGPIDDDLICRLGGSIGTIFGPPEIVSEHRDQIKARAFELEDRYRTLDRGRRVSH